MNRYLTTASCTLALPLLLALYGCPYSSSYHIDDAPQIPVEKTLIGKWTADKKNDVHLDKHVHLIISPKNKLEYNMDFTGDLSGVPPYYRLSQDTIHATGFLSKVGPRLFMNITVRGETFLAELLYSDKKLSLLPLCDHFTPRLVRSNVALRKSVEAHIKNRLTPSYDMDFCLVEMSRIP
ncbi:MAG: hypothetical protein ABIT96_08655 [Ferruginibacter sp.]